MTPGSIEHVKVSADKIADMAVALSELAQLNGLILTMQTYPIKPLAMGNYGINVDLRPSHAAYRGAA